MKQNIFLITIDALRADYVYQTNNNIHPFLSSLMEKSVVFNNAFSPSEATSRSFRSLFTNLYPLEFLPVKQPYFNIPKNAIFIAELFKNKGYETIGFSNNANLTRIQGYSRGFDYFYDGLNTSEFQKSRFREKINRMLGSIVFQINEKIQPNVELWKKFIGTWMETSVDIGYESTSSLIHRAMKHLEKIPKEKPIFLWLHCMEVHSPYYIAEKLFNDVHEKKIPLWEQQWLRHIKHRFTKLNQSPFTEKDMDKIKILYKCGIRDVDKIIEEFHRYLHEHSYLENGKFIITSDHGENLGDWNFLGHHDLYNSNIHVPLIIYSGKEKGELNSVFSNSHMMNFLNDLTEDKSIFEIANKYTGLAISEAGLPNNMKFAIQDDEYKIIKTNKSSKKYVLENQKEREIDHSNDKISLLEYKLNEHILKIKDSEKNKINNVINSIVKKNVHE